MERYWPIMPRTLNEKKKAGIKRLLIRGTNWIGDAVMTTPAVRSIRLAFPDAWIGMLVKPWVAPVFDHSPQLDQVLIYESEKRHKGLMGKIRMARDLGAMHFDAAILLQNAFEAAFIAWLSRIPIRMGFNTDARSLFLTHAIPCTAETKNKHQTSYYLDLIHQAGISVHDNHLELLLSERAQRHARDRLSQMGITHNAPIVGINPSATFGPAKQWFPERFAALADRIHTRFRAQILIFGGPEDQRLGEKLSQHMQAKPINLAGSTTLEEAMALIGNCSLFISNDSGLMHVAAALDVPLIALFGSTNPITTGPCSQFSRVIQTSEPCGPCLKKTCPEGHLNCMRSIDVDTVFSIVEEIL